MSLGRRTTESDRSRKEINPAGFQERPDQPYTETPSPVKELNSLTIDLSMFNRRRSVLAAIHGPAGPSQAKLPG